MKIARATRGFRWLALIVAVLCSVWIEPVHAKRAPPKEVQVDHGQYVYRASHWTIAKYGTAANGGVLEIYDRKTNQLLRWLKVYCIRINPKLERDVQDVFIVDLRFRGDSLIVTDELGDVFQVDVTTNRISLEKLSPTASGPARVQLCKS